MLRLSGWLLLIFVFVVVSSAGQISLETDGKTECPSISDTSPAKICVTYPEKLQFVDAKPSVYSIGVWAESDGLPANQKFLTVTVSAGPYAYLLRSADDKPASTIHDSLTENGKTRLDYLLATHPGIENDGNPLVLQISAGTLDGRLIQLPPLQIPVENFVEQFWRLSVISASSIIPIIFGVFVFFAEKTRYEESVLHKLNAIQITRSTEILPLIDMLLERLHVYNRWWKLFPPIWLDRLAELSGAIEPVYLFKELGELVANEPEFYQPNLHKVIKFLRLEYERQRKGSGKEKWLKHWQIEQIELSKIPPHRSLRTLADGARTDPAALIDTINRINLGRYSELLAPLLADVLQQHVDRFEPGKIEEMIDNWDPSGRQRIAIRLSSSSVPKRLSTLQLHTKSPRYLSEDYVLSTIESPLLEDSATAAWLRRAGFATNPFSPYLQNVQNLPESVLSSGHDKPLSVYVAADESECFAVALSYFARAYNETCFPVWCVGEMDVQTKTLSELILSSLATSWVKFLTLYPEQIFRVINGHSPEPRLEQRLQLAEVFGLFYRSSQDIRGALNTVFQKTYAVASKSEHDAHTQLHFTIEFLWENLPQKRLVPPVFTHDKLKQWLSLRPGGTSRSVIVLIDVSGHIKTNNRQLADLVTLLEGSSVSIVLLTWGECSISAPVLTWHPSELERILSERLNVSSSSDGKRNLDEFLPTPLETTYHARLCKAAGGSLGQLLRLGNQIIQLHATEKPDSVAFETDILESALPSVEL